MKTKEKKIKAIWEQAEGLSEEEIQRRWDKIFDILLEEVVKTK